MRLLEENNWFREMAAEQGLHGRHIDFFVHTLQGKRHCDGNRLGATAGAWLNRGTKNGCADYYLCFCLFVYLRPIGPRRYCGTRIHSHLALYFFMYLFIYTGRFFYTAMHGRRDRRFAQRNASFGKTSTGNCVVALTAQIPP